MDKLITGSVSIGREKVNRRQKLEWIFKLSFKFLEGRY